MLKYIKKCSFGLLQRGKNGKVKSLETVALQRFQGFLALARPKGLEPPTFRTGSRNIENNQPVGAQRVKACLKMCGGGVLGAIEDRGQKVGALPSSRAMPFFNIFLSR